MNLMAEISGEKARSMAELKPPFGPGFDRNLALQIEVLQLHCSELRDEGSDFCDFIGFDRTGRVVASERMGGF